MKKEYLIRIQVIWIQIIIYFILFKKKLFRVDAKVFLSTMFVSSIIFELSYWINLKNYYINILFFFKLKNIQIDYTFNPNNNTWRYIIML